MIYWPIIFSSSPPSLLEFLIVSFSFPCSLTFLVSWHPSCLYSIFFLLPASQLFLLFSFDPPFSFSSFSRTFSCSFFSPSCDSFSSSLGLQGLDLDPVRSSAPPSLSLWHRTTPFSFSLFPLPSIFLYFFLLLLLHLPLHHFYPPRTKHHRRIPTVTLPK